MNQELSNSQILILRAVADHERLAAPGERIGTAQIANHTGLDTEEALQAELLLIDRNYLGGQLLRGADRVATVAGICLTDSGRVLLGEYGTT